MSTPPKTSRFSTGYDSIGLPIWRLAMRGQAGFFEVDERLKELSAKAMSSIG